MHAQTVEYRYGFKKTHSNLTSATYMNPLFRRDEPELRAKIVRSTTKALRKADRENAQYESEVKEATDVLSALQAELNAMEDNQKVHDEHLEKAWFHWFNDSMSRN